MYAIIFPSPPPDEVMWDVFLDCRKKGLVPCATTDGTRFGAFHPDHIPQGWKKFSMVKRHAQPAH